MQGIFRTISEFIHLSIVFVPKVKRIRISCSRSDLSHIHNILIDYLFLKYTKSMQIAIVSVLLMLAASAMPRNDDQNLGPMTPPLPSTFFRNDIPSDGLTQQFSILSGPESTDEACELLYDRWPEHERLASFDAHLYEKFVLDIGRAIKFDCFDTRKPWSIPPNELQESGSWILECTAPKIPSFYKEEYVESEPLVVFPVLILPRPKLLRKGRCVDPPPKKSRLDISHIEEAVRAKELQRSTSTDRLARGWSSCVHSRVVDATDTLLKVWTKYREPPAKRPKRH